MFKKIGSNDFEKFLSSFKRLHSLLTNKNITYKIPNKNLFKQNEEKELLEEYFDAGSFSSTTTASFGVDFLLGAADGASSEATTFDYQMGINLKTQFYLYKTIN